MKFLFVVTAFYPEQAIGSIRITKFVKHLYSRGHHVTVLSLAPPPWAKMDETLWFDELDKIEWHQISQSAFFQKVMMKSRISLVGSSSATQYVNSKRDNSLSNYIKPKLQLLYTLIKALDWNRQVQKFLATSNSKETQFDFVFTSYPSLGSVVTGLAIKQKALAKNMIIDFRDPIVYGNSSFLGFRRRLEKYFLKHTDFATFVSQGLSSRILSHVKPSSSATKHAVLHNGFDENFSVANLPSGEAGDNKTKIIRFVYTGALYGEKRDLTIFFKVLDEVIDELRLEAAGVELHYAGAEGDRIFQYVVQMRNSIVIKDHGLVSRSESIDLQKRADICLLATWNTKQDTGILTGKIFEMFALRKPVLGIVSGDQPGSEIKQIIEDVGAGFCFESASSEEYQQLKEWLSSKAIEKMNKGEVSSQYNERVENFSYSQIVEKLERLLNSPSVS